MATSLFLTGGYANRVLVGLVQSMAGNTLPVPDTDLQILQALWKIDQQAGLVTGLDLRIITNSSSWELKLYQVFVEVSCLDPGPDGGEGTLDDFEATCSTGSANLALPSRAVGIRTIHVVLSPPVNPERMEISDISFIVTNVSPAPPTGPRVFVGAIPEQVRMQRGISVELEMEVHSLGIPAGTIVELALEGLPPGVTGHFEEPSITLSSTGEASTQLVLNAATDAMVGWKDVSLKAAASVPGSAITDESILGVEVACDSSPCVSPPRLRGDVNGDCRVDTLDLAMVGRAFGSTPSSINWSSEVDLNNDGVINIVDLATVGGSFGKTCQ